MDLTLITNNVPIPPYLLWAAVNIYKLETKYSEKKDSMHRNTIKHAILIDTEKLTKHVW